MDFGKKGAQGSRAFRRAFDLDQSDENALCRGRRQRLDQSPARLGSVAREEADDHNDRGDDQSDDLSLLEL